MATPMATSFFILNTLHTIGAITAPIIPVINIANTVIGIIPPNWLDISIPIGVVTEKILFLHLNQILCKI